jgi:hypothetical protein
MIFVQVHNLDAAQVEIFKKHTKEKTWTTIVQVLSNLDEFLPSSLLVTWTIFVPVICYIKKGTQVQAPIY